MHTGGGGRGHVYHNIINYLQNAADYSNHTKLSNITGSFFVYSNAEYISHYFHLTTVTIGTQQKGYYEDYDQSYFIFHPPFWNTAMGSILKYLNLGSFTSVQLIFILQEQRKHLWA